MGGLRSIVWMDIHGVRYLGNTHHVRSVVENAVVVVENLCGPRSAVYLGYISAASRPYLGRISAASRLYLGCISRHRLGGARRIERGKVLASRVEEGQRPRGIIALDLDLRDIDAVEMRWRCGGDAV